jgi:hypothetical protein
MASAALIGVLSVIVWLVSVGPSLPGSGGAGPLTGSVAVPAGGQLTGDALASSVRQRIQADGGNPSRMTCPDTNTVAQNVTTVCHGVIDDEDWAVVIFFESSGGAYTMLPV